MTRSDISIAVLAVSLLPLLYWQFWHAQPHAGIARIYRDRTLLQEVSLDHTQTIVVNGTMGQTTLQVQPQQIRFSDSPCSNKTCVLHGWLHYGGEVMACLPNHIIVQLSGGTEQFDGISF